MINKFIPLARPTLPTTKSLLTKLNDILKSGMITEHKYVQELEQKCAKYIRAKYVIAVSSGTSALILALKCLNLKGEVIIPSFTYTSDAHALYWCGLTPVFADIDIQTYNLDPLSVEKKINKRTCAIMPTHVFGNPCDINCFEKLAKKYNLKLIFDGAHSFGSLYKNKPLGEFGDVTVYSLTPSKVFTTGEGGLIATNNKNLAHKLKLAKFNGDSFNRKEEFLGMTSRMSEFQAILGLENLKTFKSTLERRLKIVDYYKNKLKLIKGISFQKIEKSNLCVYKDLTILIDKNKTGFTRDELLNEFKKNNIQSKVYFDPVLHKKKVYLQFRNINLPVTESISQMIINLPLYSYMSLTDTKKVCRVITNLYYKNN